MVTEGRIASASILDRVFPGLHRQGAWDYQVYCESECSFANLGHAITSRSGGPDGLAPCNDHTDLITMNSAPPMWLPRELRGWSQGLVESLQQRQLGIPLEMPEDNDYDRRLHALVSLELWFRTFHDRRAAADA
jgi:hypothetical protein